MLSWGLPVSLIASRLRTLVRSRRCSRGDTGLSFSNHDRTSHSSLDNGPPGSDPRGRVCLWEVAAKKVSRLRDKTHIPSICNGRKCPCRNGYTAWGSAQWESTYLGWESICFASKQVKSHKCRIWCRLHRNTRCNHPLELD